MLISFLAGTDTVILTKMMTPVHNMKTRWNVRSAALFVSARVLKAMPVREDCANIIHLKAHAKCDRTANETGGVKSAAVEGIYISLDQTL